MKQRLTELRKQLIKENLDAFFVSTPTNRHYLSGFTGSAGYLIITSKEAVLATDFRYIGQAELQAPDFQILRIGGDLSWFSQLLKKLCIKRVGFESTHLTVAMYSNITKILQTMPQEDQPALIATSGLVDNIRTIKTKEELEMLQAVVNVSDQAFTQVWPTIEPGITEGEVAWRLERAMRELGASGPSFDIIVGSGPNAALPHHRAGDRSIQAGEPIVIDMGAKLNGYCSDLTRTLCLGEPDETFGRVYDIVLGAQLTALATVRPYMTGHEADQLARQVIEKATYGDQFGHSLGHGIGLAVHEYPTLGPNSNHILEPGMVFTVEPGIYIPGWGGVRIEDMVLLEESGATVLSKAPKPTSPGRIE